jgi:diamine N-acetyltransferase
VVKSCIILEKTGIENIIKIIKASEDKLLNIRQLALDMFPKTYQKLLSCEQIIYMLDMMYSPTSLQQQLTDGAIFYLLHIDNKDSGYGSISISQQTATLHKLYLAANAQGLGLGKKLIFFLEYEAKKLGACQMELYVKRDNPARFFYEKMGYKIIKNIDKNIGGGYWMCDYLMQKEL